MKKLKKYGIIYVCETSKLPINYRKGNKMKKGVICICCLVVIVLAEVVLPLAVYGSYVRFLMDGLVNLASLMLSVAAGMILLYYSGAFEWACERLLGSAEEEDEE